MPHGTMSRNAFKSVDRLKAKPCMVTQRERRTPMAPIFPRRAPRAGGSSSHAWGLSKSTHTPMYFPSIIRAPSPKSAASPIMMLPRSRT